MISQIPDKVKEITIIQILLNISNPGIQKANKDIKATN